MKRIVVVVLLAMSFSILVIYFIKPEIIEKIWLWIVGLVGLILAFINQSTNWAGEQFGRIFHKKSETNLNDQNEQSDAFMEIYRYSRLGNRIQGLVFIEKEFVGISHENAKILPGIYKLDIKSNQITFSNDLISCSFLPSSQNNATDNDLRFSTDKNILTENDDQIFNQIFEKLSDWLEREKQPKLNIINQINSKVTSK